MTISDYATAYNRYREDWITFAENAFHIRMDSEQKAILRSIQHNRRTSVRSGTARGKDFVAAVGVLCFLYLAPEWDEEGNLIGPVKVAMTAPTGRQIRNIMIPEISKLYQRAGFLPGELMADGIRFWEYKDWFITGFKAESKNIEAWSGLHAPNIMVVVTEASGIEQVTFDAIEGILQGNSRLVLCFNPNNMVGEAYQSTKSPLYHKFKLNCLKAPNVVNKQRMLRGEITQQEFENLFIPGQVDYDWVAEKIEKPGWVIEIRQEEFDETKYDFEWNGKYYRPGDLFRIKVLGEFPEEGEDVLIPVSWIEAANRRWEEMQRDQFVWTKLSELKLGIDVAGMGRDNTVFVFRYGNLVNEIRIMANTEKRETIHMEIAGKTIMELKNGGRAYIDTIGEGAGVYSRLAEQNITGAVSVKGSFNANGLHDLTGERSFENMRAYLFWALRDALNPAFKQDLALPYNDALTQELSEIRWEVTSSGKIKIEKKEAIKERLGRSPDLADALANTFYPDIRVRYNTGQDDLAGKNDLGIF